MGARPAPSHRIQSRGPEAGVRQNGCRSEPLTGVRAATCGAARCARAFGAPGRQATGTARSCGPAACPARGSESAAARLDRSLLRACGLLRSRLRIRWGAPGPLALAGLRPAPLAAPNPPGRAWTARSCGPAARPARGSESAFLAARRKSRSAAAPQAARRLRPAAAFFAARLRGAARRIGRSFFRLIVPRQPGAPQRHLTCSTSGSKR